MNNAKDGCVRVVYSIAGEARGRVSCNNDSVGNLSHYIKHSTDKRMTLSFCAFKCKVEEGWDCTLIYK